MESFYHRTKNWKKLKTNQARFLEKNHSNVQIKFNFTSNHIPFKNLIGGHWFEAYTYNIIFEHLKRNDFDFEIYTRVNFHAPQEIFHAAGEFDIIAMVGNKILLVECKSGRLINTTSSLDRMINKTEGLRKVFDTSGNIYDYEFILVHSPYEIIPEEFISKFTSSRIQPISIREIRNSMERIFSTYNKKQLI